MIDPWEKVEISLWVEMNLPSFDFASYIEYEAERDSFTGQIRVGKIIKKY